MTLRPPSSPVPPPLALECVRTTPTASVPGDVTPRRARWEIEPDAEKEDIAEEVKSAGSVGEGMIRRTDGVG